MARTCCLCLPLPMCVRNVASLAKDFWQTSQKNSCAALGRRRPPGDIPGAGECSAGADLNRVGATRALRAALGAAGSRQPTATQLQSAPSQNRTQQWVKMRAHLRLRPRHHTRSQLLLKYLVAQPMWAPPATQRPPQTLTSAHAAARPR